MTSTIVVNALALRPGGSGVQTYIRELLRELPAAGQAQWQAIVQHDAIGEVPASFTLSVRPPSQGVVRGLHGLRPVRDADLVHGLNTALPLTQRVGAKVVTVHDLAFFDVPWASRLSAMASAQLQVRASVERADAVIANSAFTAERVRAVLGRDAVPIALAPPPDLQPPTPSEVDRVRGAYRLPSSFVLHVGNIEPRKDVGTLAAACQEANLPLVLAGARHAATPPPGYTRTLGYVPRADLAALYGAATVVAYISRYEGCGLPPLEAMACGAPLVASDIPPHRENLRDAVELVPPGRPALLAERLRELAHDPDRRAELGRAGLERTHRFGWDQTAAATVAVYRSLGVRC